MVVPIVSQHPVFRHQLGDGNWKARRRDGGDEVKNLVGVGKIRVARSPQQIADWDFKQHTDHLDGHRPNHQDHGSLHKSLLLTGPLQLSTHFPQNAPTHLHNLPYSVAGFQFLFCKSFLKRRCSFPFEYMPCAFQSCAVHPLRQQKDRLSAGPRMHPFDSYSFSSIRGFSS